MPAELALILDDKDATLELSKNGRLIDSLKFVYYHDLDEKLITNIDKLLKRTKIDINSVRSYKIQGNLGPNATSARIAEAIIEGLKC